MREGESFTGGVVSAVCLKMGADQVVCSESIEGHNVAEKRRLVHEAER